MRSRLSTVLIILFTFTSFVKAQSLKELFSKENVSNIANNLVGKKHDLNVEGTWGYQKSACEFKTDNIVKKVGGALAAATVESKINEYYTKIGIIPGKFGYIFNRDSTFINTYGNRKIRGTYSVNKETSQVKLTYLKILCINAKMDLSDKKLCLLFDADMLLKLFSLISTNSSSSGLKAIGAMADEYDGLRIGFDLKKE